MEKTEDTVCCSHNEDPSTSEEHNYNMRAPHNNEDHEAFDMDETTFFNRGLKFQHIIQCNKLQSFNTCMYHTDKLSCNKVYNAIKYF